MSNYCNVEKYRSQDFDGLTHFQPPDYEKLVFGMPSVWMYVWLCALLASELG
jgi:hypothetical protein